MGGVQENAGLLGQIKSKVAKYVDYAISKSRFVDNPLIISETVDDLDIGDVSPELAEKIRSEYGVDISKYRHVLGDNDIRHIFNRHGPHTNEALPVTAEDIKKIPDIIRNYNEVYYVPSSDGKKNGLMYRYDDGSTTYYLEEVNDAAGILRNKQMIKVPLGQVPDIKNLKAAIENKSTAALPGDAANAVPRMYVQDVRRGAEAGAGDVSDNGLAPRNNIAQPAPSVNSEIHHGVGAAEAGFTQPGHETNQVPSRSQALTGVDMGGMAALPFTSTPGNVLDTTTDYIPLTGAVKNAANTLREVRRGEFNQRRFC